MSRDERQAVVIEPDATPSLIDLSSGLQLAPLVSPFGSVDMATFAADGSLVVTTGSDNHVTLWNISTPTAPTVREFTVPEQPPTVPSPTFAVFSNDDRSLAVEDLAASSVTMFDVATGDERWQVHPGGLWQCVFSPDGSTLVVADRDPLNNGVAFYDAHTGALQRRLAVPNSFGVEYARGGAIVATTADTGAATVTLQLWDANTLAPIGEPLSAVSTTGLTLDSDPGGTHILEGTWEGTAVDWDVDASDWEQAGCRIAGRNLTQAEWRQYLPNEPYRVLCSQWTAG